MWDWLNPTKWFSDEPVRDFTSSLQQLVDQRISPNDHEVWRRLFLADILPHKLNAVLKPNIIRYLRCYKPENLALLILKCVDQVESFAKLPVEEAYYNQVSVMNALRILSRAMPYVYESVDIEKARALNADQRKHDPKIPELGPEVQYAPDFATHVFWKRFNEAPSEDDRESATEKMIKGKPFPSFEPLGSRLAKGLIDLCFIPGFTLGYYQTKDRSCMQLECFPLLEADWLWCAGIGSDASKSINFSRHQYGPRLEVLRCILTLLSQTLHRDDKLALTVVPFAEAFVNPASIGEAMDGEYARKVVTLTFSLLNTVCNFNPTGSYPYTSHWLYYGEEPGFQRSVHVLLALLDYHRFQPESGATSDKLLPHLVWDVVQEQLHKRMIDQKLLADGFARILRNPLVVSVTYMPGSQKKLHCLEEVSLLLFKLIDRNHHFRRFIAKSGHTNKLLPALLAFINNKDSEPHAMAVRGLLITLFSMSSDREFANSLNQPFNDTHNVTVVPPFVGTYGDFLLLALLDFIPAPITSEKPHLRGSAHFASLIISNVAPYLVTICPTTAIKLTNVLERQMHPKSTATFGDEACRRVVGFLLKTVSNLIQYQYQGSVHVIYALLRRDATFRKLAEVFPPKDESQYTDVDRDLVYPSVQTIMALIEYVHPKMLKFAEDGHSTEDALVQYLVETTLVGVLPAPEKIVTVRMEWDMKNDKWVTVFSWSLIHMHNSVPPIADTLALKLFQYHFSNGVMPKDVRDYIEAQQKRAVDQYLKDRSLQTHTDPVEMTAISSTSKS